MEGEGTASCCLVYDSASSLRRDKWGVHEATTRHWYREARTETTFLRRNVQLCGNGLIGQKLTEATGECQVAHGKQKYWELRSIGIPGRSVFSASWDTEASGVLGAHSLACDIKSYGLVPSHCSGS